MLASAAICAICAVVGSRGPMLLKRRTHFGPTVSCPFSDRTLQVRSPALGFGVPPGGVALTVNLEVALAELGQMLKGSLMVGQIWVGGVPALAEERKPLSGPSASTSGCTVRVAVLDVVAAGAKLTRV